MPEDREESSQDESSADPQEETHRKHSLIRALLCTGHEIRFSLQNSLTIAGIIVIPLVAVWLAAVGGDFPLPPAIAVGLLVPLWFIVGKTGRYAKSKAPLYLFGGLCSALVIFAGFSLAYALKPKVQSPNKPSTIAGPAVTSGDNSPANTGANNTFTYGTPALPKAPPKKASKKDKDQR